MKQILVVAIALIASLNSFSQSDDPESSSYWMAKNKNNKGKTIETEKVNTPTTNQPSENVPQLVPYEDLSKSLFTSKVVELPNKTQKEIYYMFKNWASTSFVNLKEVTVSETDNQMVLNYITETSDYFKTLGMKNPFSMSWYVRLVGQFKDGKMRILAYEDGNSFKPGEYNRYGSVPAVQRGTIRLTAFTQTPQTEKDFQKNENMYYRLHLQWQKNVISLMEKAQEEIKKSSSEDSKDNSW